MFVCLLGLALSACAVLYNTPFHSFSFDAISESEGIEVLDYRYGETAISAARMNPSMPRASANISGEMLRGDTLYVKWRVKSTKKVYEETVPLKQLLPRDITHQRIHFVVQEDRLFVYLVSPDRRPADMPPNGPALYHYRKVKTLYSNVGREVAAP